MSGAARGAAVRDAVLTRALEFVGSRGWDFSVDEVAAAAGVNKTTVYRRWPTKAALVSDALARTADDTVHAVDTGDIRQDLLALADDVAAALRRPEGRNALRAAFSAAGTEPDLAQRSAAFLNQRYAIAVTLIEAAQHRGAIHPDIDASHLWRAIVNPLHVEAVLTGTVAEGAASSFVDLVLHGAAVEQR